MSDVFADPDYYRLPRGKYPRINVWTVRLQEYAEAYERGPTRRPERAGAMREALQREGGGMA